MASQNANALYSPYGGYELKAKYQRNLGLATTLTTALVVLILVIAWVIGAMGQEEAVIDAPVVIKTIAELGPPPAITQTLPQVKVDQPSMVAPKVGIPTPVGDDEVVDDDVMLASRDEMAQIQAPDIVSDGSSGDIVVDIQDEEYLPSIEEFVPVEVIAEMIHYETPEYPRLAEQAGLEGVVWVKALVGKEGDVKQAVVYKSSGTPSLDDAAVKAAPACKFKPAIQNGRPVAMWVTYKVEFILENR